MPLALVGALTGVTTDHGRLHVWVPTRATSRCSGSDHRWQLGYQPSGHRDATHLRWFTRRDIVQLIEEAGWSVKTAAPSGA